MSFCEALMHFVIETISTTSCQYSEHTYQRGVVGFTVLLFLKIHVCQVHKASNLKEAQTKQGKTPFKDEQPAAGTETMIV